MNTPANTTTAHQMTAKEARIENLRIRDEQNLPLVNLTGNTYPLKSALWACGGLWNGEAKCWQVPNHKGAECQAMIDSYAAAHVKQDKQAKPTKPAPTTTTAAPAAKVQTTSPKATKAKPAAVPAIPVTTIAPGTTLARSTMAKRVFNLGMVAGLVSRDLEALGMLAEAIEVNKALAGFNAAHALLSA